MQGPACRACRPWASPQRPLSGLVASQCSAHLHGGCHLRPCDCRFSAPFPAGITASAYHCSIPESLLALAGLASLGSGVHAGQTSMWGHVCLAVSSGRSCEGWTVGALGKQAGGGPRRARRKQAGRRVVLAPSPGRVAGRVRRSQCAEHARWRAWARPDAREWGPDSGPARRPHPTSPARRRVFAGALPPRSVGSVWASGLRLWEAPGVLSEWGARRCAPRPECPFQWTTSAFSFRAQ